MSLFTNVYSVQVNATYITKGVSKSTDFTGKTMCKEYGIKEIFTEMHHNIVIKSEAPAIKGSMSVDPDLLGELYKIRFYKEVEVNGVVTREASPVYRRKHPINPSPYCDEEPIVTYVILFSLVTNSTQELL